eukprot:TRINITY_DN8285_c0_g2_i1.p1 TRINITY_DN8285_c0_g2~~TRINITY_DN8285_c0_g2_i1.p1  ORF type:complete len:174 (+),score=21.38 TRINITY_DN8285_c0_g2_i1:65-586(+)
MCAFTCKMFKVMKCVKWFGTKMFRRSSKVHTDVVELPFSEVCVTKAGDDETEGAIGIPTSYASESLQIGGSLEDGRSESGDLLDSYSSQASSEDPHVLVERLDGLTSVSGRYAIPRDTDASAAYNPPGATIRDLVWPDNAFYYNSDSESLSNASVSTRYVDASEATSSCDDVW